MGHLSPGREEEGKLGLDFPGRAGKGGPCFVKTDLDSKLELRRRTGWGVTISPHADRVLARDL